MVWNLILRIAPAPLPFLIMCSHVGSVCCYVNLIGFFSSSLNALKHWMTVVVLIELSISKRFPGAWCDNHRCELRIWKWPSNIRFGRLPASVCLVSHFPSCDRVFNISCIVTAGRTVGRKRWWYKYWIFLMQGWALSDDRVWVETKMAKMYGTRWYW